MKKKVGFVGWRGMVGSILLQQMIKNNDFQNIIPIFLTTSQIGFPGPKIPNIKTNILENAFNINYIKEMDIIVTCQGTEYTKIIYPKLKKIKWKGYWIDASSFLRLNEESIIVLDPVNLKSIIRGLQDGIKTFVGGNCTVSLMLMALGGLFKNKLIKQISVSTYQAASGAGSKFILELLNQMGFIYNSVKNILCKENVDILNVDKNLLKIYKNKLFPKSNFLIPLAGSVIPWIDSVMENGQSKEEWKGFIETNKILNLNNKNKIFIDGICVRIGSFRCHSQAFTIKLSRNISINNIINILKEHNPWVEFIDNNPYDTLKKLNPIYVSGTLRIPIGRIRKMNFGDRYLSVFSVGDQLLWGAAEPLRRMLKIIVNF